MYRTILFFSLIITVVGSVSCGDTTTSNNSLKNEISHDGTDDLTLKLNNGEHWEANSETTLGIKNMIVKVDAFQHSDSAENYHELKSTLEAEFTSIFKQCTMEGPAHDQLHNYLFPLKRLFKQLKSADSDERNKAVSELKEYLRVYSEYFE